MTTIHEVLLNGVFLTSGAYIGVYGLYILIRTIIAHIRQ
jgi:hypothetical protein